MTATFEIGADHFLLDGKPHRILSGAIHYFRVHPDQWADRIRKARLMGLNTIETYVAWNVHEPRRGEWDESGGRDLGRFLDLVAAEGMHAIVRPGPYICAEWTNGGLPVWLTATPGIGLRRSEPQYLEALTAYLERVYAILAPRQVHRGGPLVLVQIENEYGAYGADKEYLAQLVRITRDAGIEVPLTTVDQPQPRMLRDGGLPGLHVTGSFGSRAAERLATLREHQPTGPLMCSEFWDGWFDWWGGVHHTTSVADAAAELDALLAAGASVNIYMFHGGTNFGLTAGANHKGRYRPITTSYDYDAPLDEAGSPTEKYFAFRDVIARYGDVPEEVPAPVQDAPTFEVPLAPAGSVRASSGVRGEHPLSFDELGPEVALAAYEAPLPGAGVLAFGDVRDHARVFVDDVAVGTVSRTEHERAVAVPPGSRVRVLVEELGRVNYDARLGEAKGLIGAATLDGEPIVGWTASPIDAPGLHALAAPGAPVDPGADVALFCADVDLDETADLFLSTDGWGRGYAFANGFLLGRYWRNGPQRTLYVPGSALRRGANRIVIAELEGLRPEALRFVPRSMLGATEE